jgi:hypothetical protein
MRYMNSCEIDAAARRWQDHPVLGPATATLAALRDAADACSDGWAYWPKPARAAARLMTLIEGDCTARYLSGDRPDATPEALRAALRPVKAFRTRHGLDFPVTETLPAAPDTTPARPRTRAQPGPRGGHTGDSRLLRLAELLNRYGTARLGDEWRPGHAAAWLRPDEAAELAALQEAPVPAGGAVITELADASSPAEQLRGVR